MAVFSINGIEVEASEISRVYSDLQSEGIGEGAGHGERFEDREEFGKFLGRTNGYADDSIEVYHDEAGDLLNLVGDVNGDWLITVRASSFAE